MSLSISKKITVNKITLTHGLVLGSEIMDVEMVYTADEFNISGNSAVARVKLTMNGLEVPTIYSYEFTYNPTGGDVERQAEDHMLTLPDFEGAMQS